MRGGPGTGCLINAGGPGWSIDAKGEPRKDCDTPPAMRPVSVLLSCLAAALGCASPLPAQLKWETTTHERRAGFGEEELTFTFAFRNEGTSPITVTSIAASCGCTVPTLERRTYAPGEGGTLDVTYRTEGQTGAQTRTVTVKTDLDETAATTLTLKIDVPHLFDVSPRLVTWAKDGEAAEKNVEIVLHRVPGTTVTLEEKDHEHLDLVLAPNADGTRYTLRLRPKSTRTVFRATLRLRVESEGLPSRLLTVYADLR